MGNNLTMKNRKKNKKDTSTRLLEKAYYNLKHPGSLGGVSALTRATKQKRNKVKEWLSFEDVYTLHKPVRRKFLRRRTIVGGIDHQWQADLIDLQKLKKENAGHVFLLTCIDVLSKHAWVVPLKDKTGATLVRAFQQIFSEGRKPLKLQTDKGTEFKNRVVQKFLRDTNVDFFTTENDDIKAAVVERFNRTLKERMWRYFTKTNSTRYLDVLPDLVRTYNHTFHHSIRRAPSEVNTKNQEDVWYQLYGRNKNKISIPKLKVGDRVRISKTRRVFKKGYLPSWTRELFTVHTVINTSPVTYTIKDDHDEVLKGTFYEQELQKVGDKEVYQIKAVLDQRRKKGGQREYLVKWLGYDASFNQWIPQQALSS